MRKRTSLIVLGLAVFCFLGTYVHADSVAPDPNWAITDPTCPESAEFCPNPITDPNGVTNTILSANGGGIFQFTNLTDPATHIVSIFASTAGDIGVFNCASDAFHWCGSEFDPNANVTHMVFSTSQLFDYQHPELFGQENDNGGIQFRSIFTFNFNGLTADDLNTPGDTGGFQPFQVISWGFNDFPTITAPAVPEPSSLLLMAGGLGALFARRRKRK